MINITLHQLNALKAVQQHGSITKAAQALHITQPAVSNILKQLERKYRYALTETIGKKIYLTPAGNRLVTAADRINAELESAASDINALHGQLSGTLNVTIVSTAKYFVPKLLGQFRQLHPNVKVKLTVCNRENAIETLKDNSSDFLVMSQPPTDINIYKQPIYEDQLVIVASPNIQLQHKLEQLSDLSDDDWIIREPGSGTRIVMKKLFKQHKIAPHIAMEVSNNESIKQLIMANMGISIISKQSIELELQHKLIKILNLPEFPMPHPWYLVTNKGKHINRITKEFFNFAHTSGH